MDFGVIIDVETTGLSPVDDKIIEIGVLEFAVGSDAIPKLLRTYGALEDPGQPLKEEIVRITGLSDEVLAGQRIDWSLVRGILSRASLIVAHNADFDRKFIERVPELQDLGLHWACSMRHIDWRKHRFNALALNYLAADHGFINPFAHRAVFDCATTFRLIGEHLEELIARSYEREYLIRAVGSPIETKDLLKQRGYRWEPEIRCWTKILGEGALAEERSFLKDNIYKGRGAPEEVAL